MPEVPEVPGVRGMLVHVRAEYDAEAAVWVAESEDIPLVTEAATLELLRAKLPDMVRDVLESNNLSARDVQIDFSAHAREPLDAL
jgi:hypothetical protein